MRYTTCVNLNRCLLQPSIPEGLEGDGVPVLDGHLDLLEVGVHGHVHPCDRPVHLQHFQSTKVPQTIKYFSGGEVELHPAETSTNLSPLTKDFPCPEDTHLESSHAISRRSENTFPR